MTQAFTPYGNFVAGARVTASAAFSGKTFGLASITHTGTGVTTLELGTDNHIPSQDRVIIVTPEATSSATTFATVDVGASDERLFVVRTFNDAGAAADRTFQVGVFRKGING